MTQQEEIHSPYWQYLRCTGNPEAAAALWLADCQYTALDPLESLGKSFESIAKSFDRLANGLDRIVIVAEKLSERLPVAETPKK